ncbi:MAG: HEAT repeat domain-containing protein [Acidobacteriota bacterium]
MLIRDDRKVGRCSTVAILSLLVASLASAQMDARTRPCLELSGSIIDGQSKGESSLERAKQLWEMAIAAKGGRERLKAVQSIAITQTFSVRGSSTELCVFPDKYWAWEDRRPSKLGLAAEVRNFQQNVGYFVVGHLPNDPKKSELKPEARWPLTECQLLYLLETRWSAPELLKASRSKVGSTDVDVLEVKIDPFRVAVYLDSKTPLPVRIGYLSKYTGKIFQWHGFSDYREANGIFLPHTISYDGDRSIPLQVEINVHYDPAVFERPPRIDEGPFQWRAKGVKPTSNNSAPPKPDDGINPKQIQQAINQLHQKDENVYIEGRDLLLRAGPIVIPALTDATKGKRGEQRYRLASILLELDEENETAVNAFHELLLDRDEDGLLRRHSAFQLASCNKGIMVLISLLKNKDVFVRRSVLFAFDELTEQSKIPDLVKKAVPLLKELLKDSDEIVRGMAEEVLEQITATKSNNSACNTG